MSVFIPFKAFRPTKKSVLAVASKPYDVLNAAEAKAESEGNPLSYYHVVKPEIDFPEDQDPFAAEVYEKGKENLEKLIDQGILVQDEDPHFYVYRIQMDGHTQTGLVGCCSIDDYFNNVIKKHELTKPAIEESRKKHITTSEFTYEPVFFSYRKVNAIDALVGQVCEGVPEYDFTSSDGNQHTLWMIEDESMICEITSLFESQVPDIYIADGHHRTAAGALAGRELRNRANGSRDQHRYGDLMCVVFPHDQVRILDYNRVIKNLNGLSFDEFRRRLEENFEIEEMASEYRPALQHEMGMYHNHQWYKITARPGTFDPGNLIDQLGFTILSNLILEPLLNIKDLRTDKRIDFVGGIRGLKELEKRVDSKEMELAFAMHPITMSQLIEISDNDLILPPKVTWFEPKLRSGLFAHGLKGQYDLEEAEH